jgi:hypothetical protein
LNPVAKYSWQTGGELRFGGNATLISSPRTRASTSRMTAFHRIHIHWPQFRMPSSATFEFSR